MKTSPRILLGVLSSLLFSVGLVRAASVLDPVSREQKPMTPASLTIAGDCTNFCDYADRTNIAADCTNFCDYAE